MAFNDTCACGFAGALCEELLEGLASATDALDAGCVNGECRVVKAEAICRCDSGWRDDLCDRFAEPLEWNWAVGILLPLGLIFACGYYARARLGPTFESVKPSDLVTSPFSWATPKVILGYRVFIFLFWSAIAISQYANKGVIILVAFTIMNSNLLWVYFGVGSYLSFKALRAGPPAAGEEERPLNLLERSFWVAQQVELVTALLIAAVVWFILLPAVVAQGDDTENVVNFNSFFQHGINVFFMFVDWFFFSNLYIVRSHVVFAFIWSCIYALFHILWLLIRDVSLDRPLTPIYPFLSPESGALAIWEIGLLVVISIFWGLALLFNRLKRNLVGNAAAAEDGAKVMSV